MRILVKKSPVTKVIQKTTESEKVARVTMRYCFKLKRETPITITITARHGLGTRPINCPKVNTPTKQSTPLIKLET